MANTKSSAVRDITTSIYIIKTVDTLGVDQNEAQMRADSDGSAFLGFLNSLLYFTNQKSSV